jgi:hypothetical protein
MDWDRLATQMIREMIRQFLREPGEFLTFGQLAFRIPGADREVLHLVADSRPDLFAVARNDKALKLHTNAVQKILRDGIDAAAAQPHPVPAAATAREGRIRCGHFAQEELLADLQRCSLPPEALTRNCCWTEICRIRALSHPPIDFESWREICVTRGYLLARENPRGF